MLPAAINVPVNRMFERIERKFIFIQIPSLLASKRRPNSIGHGFASQLSAKSEAGFGLDISREKHAELLDHHPIL
jgi:hypothetical protein